MVDPAMGPAKVVVSSTIVHYTGKRFVTISACCRLLLSVVHQQERRVTKRYRYRRV